MNFDVTHPDVAEAVRRALEEDIGPGDITSQACVPEGARALGKFVAREPLVVAGVELLPLIYRARGGFEELRGHLFSGQQAEPGQVIAEVRARARTLLECERVALNFLQRLSGIATLARRFAEAVEDLPCRILDTRKTTPGLRRLEKMAAAAGGIVNHRMGLYDAILIKNNHVAIAGGVGVAVERARATGLPVEVEVRNRHEVSEALAAGADRLLLDNYSPEQAAEEIRFIAGRAVVEISGGITLDNVRAYAEAGPDFISAGAITHSARAMDINFRLEPLP
ncbi:MAG TPA: carboxylating nicotinate-nucleotide diphosphorylase [Bryobacteraceae bacterium]|nr:carboxylating nicotinate-nucleotide diphosphorylase [Bryobacteraceae bacterium]